MLRSLTFILAALSLSVGAYAGAQTTTNDQVATGEMSASYNAMDNDHGVITEDEFNARFEQAGFFDNWDANANGVLDEDELEAGLYDTWGQNDRGILTASENEFANSTSEMSGSYDAMDNDRGVVTADEFDSRLEEVGYFDEWDTNADGVLDEDELEAGLYDTWDQDDDGILNGPEVEEAGFWDW